MYTMLSWPAVKGGRREAKGKIWGNTKKAAPYLGPSLGVNLPHGLGSHCVPMKRYRTATVEYVSKSAGDA